MTDEKRFCPFKKKTMHYAGRNSGDGYPVEWKSEEALMPCIGEKCMAYFNEIKMCKLIDY